MALSKAPSCIHPIWLSNSSSFLRLGVSENVVLLIQVSLFPVSDLGKQESIMKDITLISK